MSINAAVAAQFENGKGVLVLSPSMTDAELASAVRSAMAMSKGVDFTVSTHLPKHIADTLLVAKN